MNKKVLLVVFVGLIVGLLLAVPVAAQEQEPLEPIPISGTFSYAWEILHLVETENFLLQHAREDEVWSGDLEGTGEAEYRLEFWTSPPVMRYAFLVEFTGMLLDEYEGTLTMVLTGPDNNLATIAPDSPFPPTFFGEWKIVSGTGDLANVHGYGFWWGPGNFEEQEEPDDIPDIAWSGEVYFMEPVDD